MSTAGDSRNADSKVCKGATLSVERLKTGVCDVRLRAVVARRPETPIA